MVLNIIRKTDITTSYLATITFCFEQGTCRPDLQDIQLWSYDMLTLPAELIRPYDALLRQQGG
jgi:hypothetical protein